MRKFEKTQNRYTSNEGIISGHGRIVRFNIDGVKVIDRPEWMVCLVNENRDWFADTARNSSLSSNEINFESNNIR